MTQVTDITIRKSIAVPCSPEEAFALFTEGASSWWPLATHSAGKEKARSVVVEGRVGGRIYEIWDDGQERDWGTVRVWKPPRRVVYSWQPNPDRMAPTEVEVRIVPDGDGDGARLELEHRGWERLGEQAEESHSDYDRGWNAVLGAYAAGPSAGA